MLASSEKLEPIAPYVGQIVGRVERRASGAEQWLLVRCVGKSDNHVASVLKNAGISHYYPMIREFKPLPMRKLSAKQRASGVVVRRPTLVPLLPRYHILNLDMRRTDLDDVFALAGLGGIVCEGGRMIIVPQGWVDDVRRRENEGAIPGSTTARLVFSIGQKVKIAGSGPFAGLDALVDENLDVPIEELDPDTRIRVAISLLGRMSAMSVVASELEKT